MARGDSAVTVGITPEKEEGQPRLWRWCSRAPDGTKLYTSVDAFTNRGAAVRQARAAHPGLKITIAAE